MSGTDAERLSREILDAVEQPGQLKNWLEEKSKVPAEEGVLGKACVLASEALLSAEPPKAAEWEQLLIQLSVHSHKSRNPSGMDPCKSVLGKLHEMIEADRFASVDHRKIVTITGALTVALAAQRGLKQPIEEVMKSLCGRFENEFSQIAEQCQDIWMRKGQTSGEVGLFLWDTRNRQWRLTQEFKAYPT